MHRELVMDREAWHVVVHRVTKSYTGLKNNKESARIRSLCDEEKTGQI